MKGHFNLATCYAFILQAISIGSLFVIYFPVHIKAPICLYTMLNGISRGLQTSLLDFGAPNYEWVQQPELADYFVLPCNYETGHELSDFYLGYFKGRPEDRTLALLAEEALVQLSRQFGKPILVFFFSDSNEQIDLENAIVFRTSMLASKAGGDEHTMPAFRQSQQEFSNGFTGALPWQEKPAVGFRGQALPLQLVGSRRWKNAINNWTAFNWKRKPFRINAIDGYLLRRNAIRFLKKYPAIQPDVAITTEQDIHNDESVRLFSESITQNPYTLCVAGIGNYSYRLYEVLSAGRIPVFVNTDCKLPFDDIINWQHHVVWIEDWQLPRIGEMLLDFHQKHKGQAFQQMQENNHTLWKNYLSKDGFFRKIGHYL